MIKDWRLEIGATLQAAHILDSIGHQVGENINNHMNMLNIEMKRSLQGFNFGAIEGLIAKTIPEERRR